MNWSRKVHEPFVYAALGIALTAGFGFGALLVISPAAGARQSSWYGAVAQAHGHAELFGWVGLFVLGVGLYFLPRLRARQLKGISRVPWAFGLLVGGIALRSVAQPLGGWVGTNEALRLLFLLSSILELAGMIIVVSMLVETERGQKRMSPEAPAYAVEPFVQLAFLSLTMAFLINFLGVWNAVAGSKNLIAPRYDQLVITLWLYGAVIPMAMVFCVRTLPLYLFIEPSPHRLWRTLASFYFFGLVFRVAPYVFAVADDAVILTGRVLRASYINVLLLDALATLGVVMLNGVILIFVWQLGLSRQRVQRGEEGGAAFKAMRRGWLGRRYYDNGLYGRFELLIYSALAWLAAASVLDLLRQLPVVNERVFVPMDAARHALMVGFITLLIFGMAVRMLPGFSGKRGVAYPGLVIWLFVLGNVAAILRVAPFFFPNTAGTLRLVALSGIVGWSAVLLLAIILWKTFRVEPRPGSVDVR